MQKPPPEPTPDPDPPKSRVRDEARMARMATAALFAALSYCLGTISIIHMNLEPKTLTIFMAGVVGGPFTGLEAGLLGCLLHNLLNPLGLAPVLTMVGQAIAWAAIGALGDAGGRWARSVPRAVLVGGLVTLLFHVITDAAGGIENGVGFRVYFLGGFAPPYPFTAVHIGSNACLFGVAVPYLVEGSAPWRHRLGLPPIAGRRT